MLNPNSVLMYPQPPSLLIKAASVFYFVFLGSNGISEFKGKNMNYSKFWNVGSDRKSTVKISGKTGMIVLYTPSFLFALASFYLFPNLNLQDLHGLRFVFVRAALTIHFFKRLFEVLFIHKYSGKMFLDVATIISSSYFISTATIVYAQNLTLGMQEPAIDLKYAGIVVFLIGIIGNFYHHYLLSKLRGKNDKEYKIPKGGLFGLVICPHYLFEILGFIGVSCMAQTWFAFSFTFGSGLMLMGRSYATRKWYISKFEDFPKNVKAIIPYVF